MHVVKSNIATKIAYGENPTVVFGAFETKTLTDADWNRLTAPVGETPSAFARHLKRGDLVDVPQAKAAPDPVTPPPPVEDPRKQRKGEKKPDFDARMIALDKAEADAKWLIDFRALAPEEQSAMQPTLTDEQRALIAADDAAKGAV